MGVGQGGRGGCAKTNRKIERLPFENVRLRRVELRNLSNREVVAYRNLLKSHD
jgi:hypothetical protein